MNSPQPRASWSERIQPRSWPLPVKLVAVVAVPALFAITLGVLRVLDQSTAAAEFDRVDRVATVQERFAALTVALQEERQAAVEFVAVDQRKESAAFEAATRDTDQARTDATAVLGDAADLDPGAVGALHQVDNNYFRLTQLRRQVLTGANDAADLHAQYAVVVEPLLVFDAAVTRQLSDPEVSGLSQAIGALGEAREQVATQEAVVTAALATGSLSGAQADALAAADARLGAATATVRSVLSDEQQRRYTGFAGSVAATREQLTQSVVDRGRGNLPLEVAPEAWTAASGAVLSEIDSAASGARSELREISATQKEAASNQAGVSSVFLLLAILLGAAVVYLVAKALINSLRTLRTAALDVADRRLPEAVQSMREGAIPDVDVAPVPVTTREEVGQVARAFDAVHSQAVRLAAEQATLQANVSSMFANLSRRSQALAERQLKLIEQLESNEQDPDQLANLFQLDSLATRMRRNSENLLVLSGTDLSKRATQPVPVVDVLRAAVSEVEQYQRVVVQSPPDATIAGRAASDIVHLIAELVDNATNFSPPDTQVVMSSQRTPDGAVLVEILDRGVGMGPDELAGANERLARPTALDVSVSRRMGLFVVGRLAARHGVTIRLGGGHGGTTASVTVPGYLVTAAPGADLGGVGGPPRPPALPPVPPSDEFVPSPRAGGPNGQRPAPLSALVAGSDAPAGSPGGPLPGTPTRRPGGATTPPLTLNGHTGAANGSDGESGRRTEDGPAVPPGELPVRRPGQMLGQAPSQAPDSERSAAERSGALPQRTPRPAGDRSSRTAGDLFGPAVPSGSPSGSFGPGSAPNGQVEQSGPFALRGGPQNGERSGPQSFAGAPGRPGEGERSGPHTARPHEPTPERSGAHPGRPGDGPRPGDRPRPAGLVGSPERSGPYPGRPGEGAHPSGPQSLAGSPGRPGEADRTGGSPGAPGTDAERAQGLDGGAPLPVRRPGRALADGPGRGTPSSGPGSAPSRPGSVPPAPNGTEPPGARGTTPRPADAPGGPAIGAPEPAPATEAFLAQKPGSARPAPQGSPESGAPVTGAPTTPGAAAGPGAPAPTDRRPDGAHTSAAPPAPGTTGPGAPTGNGTASRTGGTPDAPERGGAPAGTPAGGTADTADTADTAARADSGPPRPGSGGPAVAGLAFGLAAASGAAALTGPRPGKSPEGAGNDGGTGTATTITPGGPTDTGRGERPAPSRPGGLDAPRPDREDQGVREAEPTPGTRPSPVGNGAPPSARPDTAESPAAASRGATSEQDRASADHPAADRPDTDRAAADRLTTDRPGTDRTAPTGPTSQDGRPGAAPPHPASGTPGPQDGRPSTAGAPRQEPTSPERPGAPATPSTGGPSPQRSPGAGPAPQEGRTGSGTPSAQGPFGTGARSGGPFPIRPGSPFPGRPAPGRPGNGPQGPGRPAPGPQGTDGPGRPAPGAQGPGTTAPGTQGPGTQGPGTQGPGTQAFGTAAGPRGGQDPERQAPDATSAAQEAGGRGPAAPGQQGPTPAESRTATPGGAPAVPAPGGRGPGTPDGQGPGATAEPRPVGMPAAQGPGGHGPVAPPAAAPAAATPPASAPTTSAPTGPAPAPSTPAPSTPAPSTPAPSTAAAPTPAPQAPPAHRPDARPTDRPGLSDRPHLGIPAAPAGGPASPQGPLFGAAPPRSNDPSETTPIFAEIASAWFLDDRPVPFEAPAGPVAPIPPAPADDPLTVRPAPSRPAADAVPAGDEPAAEPVFASTADDGWRASAAAAEAPPEELTPAGLPRRRPRARLVPGAAGPVPPSAAPVRNGQVGRPGGAAQPAPQVSSARSAEAIRGRLSSYQDGVRQAREARMRRIAAAAAAAKSGTEAGKAPVFAPGSNGHRDEEGT